MRKKDYVNPTDATKTTPKLSGKSNRQKLPFSVIESYKSIRTNMLSLIENSENKVIAFSSPNASEGKSTTSINLAMAISHMNKRVLLLDTDTHRPTIHNKLKIENKVGCMDIISGVSDIESATYKYSEYLDIITSGAVPANPTEMFESPNFDNLIAELKKHYDYIIIDTPPINLVSDSLIIAKKSDCLVLVLRSLNTTYDAFKKTMSSIRILKIKLLGVIINATDFASKKYYKYNSYKSYRTY